MMTWAYSFVRSHENAEGFRALAWQAFRIRLCAQFCSVASSPSVSATSAAPTALRQMPTSPAPQPSSRHRLPALHAYFGLFPKTYSARPSALMPHPILNHYLPVNSSFTGFQQAFMVFSYLVLLASSRRVSFRAPGHALAAEPEAAAPAKSALLLRMNSPSMKPAYALTP